MPRRQAFTLVEMLLVIAIIVLLISLLLPSMGRAKDHTNRLVCASHQRALVNGMIMYARDDLRGRFLPTSHYTVDDIRPIVPEYATQNAAICPSTKHRAENLTASYGSPAPSAYHSYEMFSWIGRGSYPNGREYKDFVHIRRSTAQDPSKIWIPMDDSSLHGNNNWPDPGNNHGAEGLNLGYVDGHAGWHDRKDYVIASLFSYHPWFGNSGTTLSLAQSAVPNVANVGGWHGSWWLDN